MPGPGTEKHDAGRYICQRSAAECKRRFKQSGVWEPCPLAAKCARSPEARGQLERFWPLGKYGKLLVQSSQKWNEEHLKRRNELKNVFAKEEMRAYYAAYRKRKPEKAEAAQAKFAAKKQAEKELLEELERDIHADQTISFGEGARHLLLPCGEDCRNCPEPEGPDACPYTDTDEDALMEQEYGRKGRGSRE